MSRASRLRGIDPDHLVGLGAHLGAAPRRARLLGGGQVLGDHRRARLVVARARPPLVDAVGRDLLVAGQRLVVVLRALTPRRTARTAPRPAARCRPGGAGRSRPAASPDPRWWSRADRAPRAPSPSPRRRRPRRASARIAAGVVAAGRGRGLLGLLGRDRRRGGRRGRRRERRRGCGRRRGGGRRLVGGATPVQHRRDRHHRDERRRRRRAASFGDGRRRGPAARGSNTKLSRGPDEAQLDVPELDDVARSSARCARSPRR